MRRRSPRPCSDVDHLLRGVPGIVALVDQYETVAAITARLDALDAFADEREALLEGSSMSPEQIEGESATLIALRDALWAMRRDRLRAASEVARLAGREAGAAALAGYFAVQQSLSAIDRLEVRGRDSAGLHLFVWNTDLDADDPVGVAARTVDPLFQSGSVASPRGMLVVRLQGGGRDRRTRRQHPARCAEGSPATTSCVGH